MRQEQEIAAEEEALGKFPRFIFNADPYDPVQQRPQKCNQDSRRLLRSHPFKTHKTSNYTHLDACMRDFDVDTRQEILLSWAGLILRFKEWNMPGGSFDVDRALWLDTVEMGTTTSGLHRTLRLRDPSSPQREQFDEILIL